MSVKIKIQFSEEVSLFGDLLNIKYDEYTDKLMGTLPLVVGIGKYDIDDIIIKSEFSFEIPSVHYLEKIRKDFHYWDTQKWFQKHFPNETICQRLISKAEKYISTDILEPIEISETNYVCGTEFIEVDENSSFCGNFTQNNKEGCHLQYGDFPSIYDWEEKKLDNLDVNLASLLSRYDFPYNHRPEDLYEKSNEERAFLFNSLELKEKLEIYKTLLKRELSYANEEFLPFFIRLSGNDDDSWTKYFSTEEEMLQEVYLLRRVQPINKWEDVKLRGYEFTN